MTTDLTTPVAGPALTRAQLLGKRVDVLDKGWIELQDLMGDDLAIVNAARASFLGESKGTERDKKLLFYLLQHRHTTPFEQVEFKFRVRAPVVTWWQWVRHRTWSFNAQCLAGDTEVIFDKPEMRDKGALRVGSKIRIADLYRRWNTWERERLREMKLRMLNEDTMLLETAQIGDVLHAGVKPGFRITTDDGRHITCSADHRFLFEGGWQTVGEATGLEVVNGRAVYNSLPRLYVNGRKPLPGAYLYTDRVWLEYQYHTRQLAISEIARLAGCTEHTIRKYLTKHQLTLPDRSAESRFKSGQTTWNKDKTYSLSETPDQRLARRERAIRSVLRGEQSNFWKGGVSPQRAQIGRWTTDVAPLVFARDQYRCALCGGLAQADDPLHAHHIVPVWADESMALDMDNLITLHQSCHIKIHRENLEAEYALRLRPGAPFDLSRKEQYHREALRPNGHATPHLVEIERIEYVGEIEMFDLVVDGPYPNFIANWFVVHNSGRYVAFEENDFYVPSTWRRQSPSNKQASLGELSNEEGQPLSAALAEHYERGFVLYKQALEAGVAREQARLFLPGFAIYYTWVAKTDAHNLMHFLSLRMADEAQYEIRVYAQAIYEHFFKPALPWTAEAFEKFTLTQNS